MFIFFNSCFNVDSEYVNLIVLKRVFKGTLIYSIIKMLEYCFLNIKNINIFLMKSTVPDCI